VVQSALTRLLWHSSRGPFVLSLIAVLLSLGLLVKFGPPPEKSLWEATDTRDGDPVQLRRNIKWSFDRNIETDWGLSLLEWAVFAGHREVVAELLHRGTDVNTKHRGETALHYAARMGDIEMVRLLIARGADPLASDAHGRTPYDHAVQYGYSDVAAFLARAEAERGQEAPRPQKVTEPGGRCIGPGNPYGG